MTISEAHHWDAYKRTGLTTLERQADPEWKRRRDIQTVIPDAMVAVVYGKPTQQGSKRTAKGTSAMWEDAAVDLAPWREAVKYAVLAQIPEMIRKPGWAEVWITTSRQRPTSHWGTGRNAGILKPQFADARPTTYPDGDKLERAILDALKWGGAYEDDAQVTDMHWRKRYATPGSPDPWILDRPGAVIVVRGATGAALDVARAYLGGQP